jgi:hypothetical protein
MDFVSLMFLMTDTLYSLLLTKPACCEFCNVLIRVQFQTHLTGYLPVLRRMEILLLTMVCIEECSILLL